MGLFPAKKRVIQAAAAALAFFAVPALAEPGSSTGSSSMRAPASQADQQERPPVRQVTNQTDSFATAGEQAVFVGAYQMYFGPYGKIANQEDRSKMIRETAASIDDCLNGRDCDANKQEKVLKALMQFNMGQDVKRMMLTNNTNKEAMRSIDNSDSAETAAKRQGVLSQKEIQEALSRGKEFAVDNSDPIKPHQTGKVAELNRASGTTKDPYYQLNEAEVSYKIDETYLREREILGEKFLKDYSAFLDDFSASDDRISKRFYKYVPARNDSKVSVYEGQGSVINCYKDKKWCAENSSLSVNTDRMNEVQTDQKNKKVRSMIENYRKNLTAMQGYRGDDGQVHVIKDGSHPKDLGFGEMTQFDPALFPDIKFDDLMENGKITPANRSRAIARVVNQQFKRVADDADRKSKESRNLASADDPNTRSIHNITLSPESFDQFLDEIWPSAAKRQNILSSTPAPEPSEQEPSSSEGQEPDTRPENSSYYQRE